MMTKEQYDAYIAGQIALGRDVSEYRPEIREKWAAIKQAQRDGRWRSARGRHDGEDLFGGDFAARRMPLWRRFLYRLGGWDA